MTVLFSKISAPSLPSHFVARQALSPNQENCSILFIYGPAGYGKSILACSLLPKDKPIFWYALDKHDNDVSQFLDYIITGFSQFMSIPAQLIERRNSHNNYDDRQALRI